MDLEMFAKLRLIQLYLFVWNFLDTICGEEGVRCPPKILMSNATDSWVTLSDSCNRTSLCPISKFRICLIEKLCELNRKILSKTLAILYNNTKWGKKWCDFVMIPFLTIEQNFIVIPNISLGVCIDFQCITKIIPSFVRKKYENYSIPYSS